VTTIRSSSRAGAQTPSGSAPHALRACYRRRAHKGLPGDRPPGRAPPGRMDVLRGPTSSARASFSSRRPTRAKLAGMMRPDPRRDTIYELPRTVAPRRGILAAARKFKSLRPAGLRPGKMVEEGSSAGGAVVCRLSRSSVFSLPSVLESDTRHVPRSARRFPSFGRAVPALVGAPLCGPPTS